MTYNPVFEYKVSSLIESQFPEFYRENGPAFVAFVKAYYQWLEGSQVVANTSTPGQITGRAIISAGSANVTGIGTNFTTTYASGQQIAIFHEDTMDDYDLFLINSVSNNTLLTLDASTIPDFSSSNSAIRYTYTENNPNYYLRRFIEEKDIDTTADQFLVYFKEKYLKNIQYDTKSNIKNLLKHSLDIYRSKGTPRALDLVFRAVFGVPASVYYPKDDVFRLSDGVWYVPTYLEISLKDSSNLLIGKQIVGLKSGATAFAEALIRRTVKDRLIDVLYISSVKGNFLVDETINTKAADIAGKDCPVVIGSLTTVDVDVSGTGQNFAIGDVVDLYSDWGEQGQARVTSITNTTGQVTFTLIDGGYGYTANSQVLVSQEILLVGNVQIDANNIAGKNYVYVFDNAIQPLANISYNALSNSWVYHAGDLIYTYYANGTLDGTGRILVSSQTSVTNGTLFVSILSGNLQYANIYSSGNTSVANVVTYVNATCSGNVIGYYDNVNFIVANLVGNYTTGEAVYQKNSSDQEIANGVIYLYQSNSATTGIAKVSNVSGVFYKNKPLIGRTSNASAIITETQLYVGVTNVSNVFYTTSNNYLNFACSLSNATILSIGQGSLANVSIASNLSYTETVTLGTDYVRDYLTVPLNATAYGFPAFPTGNLTNGTVAQQLTEASYEVGRVQALIGVNPGSNYSLAPIVRVFEPATLYVYRQDVILSVANTEGTFKIGEEVTQDDTSGRGLIKWISANAMGIELLRMTPNNDFVVTTNTAQMLVGANSLATANITLVSVDPSSEYLGFNADIGADVRVAAGAVTKLEVTDSGFGYLKSDGLRFVKTGMSPDLDANAGFGQANLLNQGKGSGFYKRKGGFLSDQKKLFDGVYYQDFSYEVRSSITLDKYEDMLKKLLHLAGTKYFGAFVYSTAVGTQTSFDSTTINQT